MRVLDKRRHDETPCYRFRATQTNHNEWYFVPVKMANTVRINSQANVKQLFNPRKVTQNINNRQELFKHHPINFIIDIFLF